MFGGYHMDHSNTQPEHRDLVDRATQAISLCLLLYHYRFELAHYWYVLHHLVFSRSRRLNCPYSNAAIIIQKIWRTNKKSAPYITHASQSRSSRPPRTKLENVIRIILESGMLYTITVLITFICELAGSNAIYGVSDVVSISTSVVPSPYSFSRIVSFSLCE